MSAVAQHTLANLAFIQCPVSSFKRKACQRHLGPRPRSGMQLVSRPQSERRWQGGQQPLLPKNRLQEGLCQIGRAVHLIRLGILQRLVALALRQLAQRLPARHLHTAGMQASRSKASKDGGAPQATQKALSRPRLGHAHPARSVPELPDQTAVLDAAPCCKAVRLSPLEEGVINVAQGEGKVQS